MGEKEKSKLKPIGKETIVNQIINEIIDSIVNGIYKAGMKFKS